MCWVQHGGQGFQSSREVSIVLGSSMVVRAPAKPYSDHSQGPVDPPGTCSAPV